MTVEMLTPAELASLQAIINREQCPAPDLEQLPADIAAGDVVQLRPFADATFGGMLALVTKADPFRLRAYLLTPHRGGCREAWVNLKPTDVERIGRSCWPDAGDFPRRCPQRGPGCHFAR